MPFSKRHLLVLIRRISRSLIQGRLARDVQKSTRYIHIDMKRQCAKQLRSWFSLCWGSQEK